MKVRSSLGKKGVRFTAAATPGEVADRAMRLGINGKIGEFMAMYERHRFGGGEMSKDERMKYKRLVKEIRKQAGSHVFSLPSVRPDERHEDTGSGKFL